jgi:hypothetical protein
MATIGYGTSHKDSKHADKCSNNKTKTKISKMTIPQTNAFSKYCNDNTKKFDINCSRIIQSPYNKQ